MSIVVHWDDEEQSIIRWEFGEKWSWDDFYAAFDQSLQMAQTVDHRIDVIPDLTRSTWVPPNALTNFNRIQRQMPSNTHLIVITGGSRFDNTLITTFKAIYRINTWRTASTLDEARNIIQQERLKMRQAD